MENSNIKLMRRISAILYAILAVLNLFAIKTVLQYQSLGNTSFVTVLSVIVALVFGSIAIKLFSSDEEVSLGMRRGLVLGSVFYIAFSFLTYNVQIMNIGYSIGALLDSDTAMVSQMSSGTSPGHGLASIICLTVQLLLSLIAAFFATSAVKDVNNIENNYNTDVK